MKLLIYELGGLRITGNASGPPPCIIPEVLRNQRSANLFTVALLKFLEPGLAYDEYFGLYHEILLDYAKAELENPQLRVMIQGHLAECENCRQEVERLTVLAKMPWEYTTFFGKLANIGKNGFSDHRPKKRGGKSYHGPDWLRSVRSGRE